MPDQLRCRLILIAILLALFLVVGCRQEPEPTCAPWPTLEEDSTSDAAMIKEPTPGEQQVPVEAILVERPLSGIAPGPSLLPAGSAWIGLVVTTAAPADCRWCAAPDRPYEQMPHAFLQGQGQMIHRTPVGGWQESPDQRLFVRCASTDAGYEWDANAHLLQTHIRALLPLNPSYPRSANIRGMFGLAPDALDHLAQQDLVLGANGLSEAEMAWLRQANPDIRILLSATALDNNGLAEVFYLKNSDGKRIEAWPGAYRLNLTRADVAAFAARHAYEVWRSTDLMADGILFDDGSPFGWWPGTQSRGDALRIDADEDGQADDLDDLAAAWKIGVARQRAAFRALAPHAIIAGSSRDGLWAGPGAPVLDLDVIAGAGPVLAGARSVADALAEHRDGLQLSPRGQMILVQSSPLARLGLGGAGQDQVPQEALAFARSYSPWGRFGLALALLSDGYHVLGERTFEQQRSWWLDEMDTSLGYPVGPAARIDASGALVVELIVNGGFEGEMKHPWGVWARAGSEYEAWQGIEDRSVAVGRRAVCVEVPKAAGDDAQIELVQYDRSLVQGVEYELSFWARSNQPRTMVASAQKNTANWDNYGLWNRIYLDDTWRHHMLRFVANTTADDARIQFMLGSGTGTVVVDEVSLTAKAPMIYRRYFDHGLVLLNGSDQPQTIDVGPGYHRIDGSQAPRYDMILDDTEASGFAAIGAWQVVAYGPHQWQSSGAFARSWGVGWHRSLASGVSARWDLGVSVRDTYTVSAWCPPTSAPDERTHAALYEIVSNDMVVASTTVDQNSASGGWWFVGSAELGPKEDAYVRLTSSDGAVCAADVLRVWSSARYNDGSPAERVTLAPKDAIVLLEDATAKEILLPFIVSRPR